MSRRRRLAFGAAHERRDEHLKKAGVTRDEESWSIRSRLLLGCGVFDRRSTNSALIWAMRFGSFIAGVACASLLSCEAGTPAAAQVDASAPSPESVPSLTGAMVRRATIEAWKKSLAQRLEGVWILRDADYPGSRQVWDVGNGMVRIRDIGARWEQHERLVIQSPCSLVRTASMAGEDVVERRLSERLGGGIVGVARREDLRQKGEYCEHLDCEREDVHRFLTAASCII